MAGRGGYQQTAGLTIARLCGAGRRLSVDQVETATAVAELRAISTDVDLLSKAAGTFMAGHRHDPEVHPFDQHAADLLLEAGADLQLAEVEAAVVAERLGRRPTE